MYRDGSSKFRWVSHNIKAHLKRPCIEFGVVRIDSAMVVCIILWHTLSDNSAFVNPAGQLLLTGGVRPEWIPSAQYLNPIQPIFKCNCIFI